MHRSVLLARFQSLGDVLFTLPVIDALAADARVDLLTAEHFAADARMSPSVGAVYGVDVATGAVDESVFATTYDAFVDLHMRAVPLPDAAEATLGRIRAQRRTGFAGRYPGAYDTLVAPRSRAEHAVDCYARAVSALLDRPPGPGRIAVPPASREHARGLVAPGSVALAPGARFAWKRWPARAYAKLAGRLADAGIGVVVVGHPFDAAVVAEFREACGTPVNEVVGDTELVAAVLAECGTAVTNNSGLCALASASGARVVCVHSHTLPEMWRPWGPGHTDLVGDTTPCDCTGPDPHDLATPCGKGVPVDDVLAAVLHTRQEVPA